LGSSVPAGVAGGGAPIGKGQSGAPVSDGTTIFGAALDSLGAVGAVVADGG
jgi:hypothetical protein